MSQRQRAPEVLTRVQHSAESRRQPRGRKRRRRKERGCCESGKNLDEGELLVHNWGEPAKLRCD